MKKPLYVRVGLFAVPTRKAANGYMYFCLLVAALGLVAGLTIEAKYFAGFLLLLAALWYKLAINWMDKHDAWGS